MPNSDAASEAVQVARADPIVLTAETMTGDLRDFVLDRLRFESSPLPWNMRHEKDQKETIDRVSTMAQAFVDRMVELIAAEGRRTMLGQLVQVVSKGTTIKCQIDVSKSDPLRHALLDSQGMKVLLVVSDSSAFSGARGDVPVDPDQHSLFDENNDEGPSADDPR